MADPEDEQAPADDEDEVDEPAPPGDVNEEHAAIERHPDFAYPVDVAPSDLDDDAFFNTLRPGLNTVACWRLEDSRFEFDSSFILPDTRSDVARLAQMHRDFAGCPASIFGHADPVGGDDYNKKLSGYRAKAAFGLLVQDPKIWEELHNEHGWRLTSAQMVVLFLEKEAFIADGNFPSEFAPTFLADGKDTKEWREALKSFQRANGLSDKTGLNKDTRLKLYEQYMKALCTQRDGTLFKLDPEKDFLGEGKGPKGKAAFQGCSEFNPSILLSEDENKEFEKTKEGKEDRNKANSANRRVVLYFFPPGLEIDPAKWPCPRADEGSGGCKKRFWSNHEARRKPEKSVRRIYGRDPDDHLAEGTHDTFACRFYDRLARRSPCEAGYREWIIQLIEPAEKTSIIERERLVGISFVASVGNRKTEGVTNAEGIVRIRARGDKETIKLELTIPREQKEGEKEPRKPARVVLTLAGGTLGELEDDTTGQAMEARLRNLGYGPADPARWNITEAKKALDEFKKVNDVKDGDDLKEKLRELHGS